jgi:hypothetical protein
MGKNKKIKINTGPTQMIGRSLFKKPTKILNNKINI